jgi:ubiquinone/menaquinone biosynthesis C-methylase UbiE
LAQPEAWNLVTDGYVDEVMPQFIPFARDALRLADVRPGHHVVDVACGPGTLSFLAAELGASVSALDFADNMIEALRARAAREGVNRIESRIGDGQNLPYQDASFDAAFSMFGLIFFPDRVQGFRELHRVLKPNGRAAVASWQPLDQVPLIEQLFTSLAELMPGLPFGQNKAPLGQADEMRDELRQGGFSQIEVHELAHEHSATSVDAWWDSMQRSLAPVVLLKKQMGEPFQAIAEGVRKSLKEKFGNGPQRVVFRAHLGLGTR